MRKAVIGGIVLLSAFSYAVCSASDGSEWITIDKASIEKNIEKAAMDDGGYRFANAELESDFSVYATYYITKSKEYAGWPPVSISPETESKIERLFLNTGDMDLTDVFCAVSLLKDDGWEIADDTKENISSYFDTLYNEKSKCYELYKSNNGDDYIFNVYPNYLVYTVANLLEIEINPIDEWLKNSVEKIFAIESIVPENSSAYAMLFELSKKNSLEVPTKSTEAIVQMFENGLDHLDELENTGVYIPVFLMDFLDFSRYANYDNTTSYEKIILTICDENGIKENTLIERDVFGLYAAIRTLKLAQYDFEACNQFDDVFNEFDSFMLSEDSYIPPAYVESNFVDTYYVDALIHKLELGTRNAIGEYCLKNKSQILESDELNIYYFLELLQRNNLMEIVEKEQEDIEQKLTHNIDTLITDITAVNTNLPKINACIKSLIILDERPEISKEQYLNIVENFSESPNEQQAVYDLVKLIEFIDLISPDNRNETLIYCNQLENKIIRLSSEKTSNKVMLQSMAVVVFRKTGYTATPEFNHIVKRTLRQAQDRCGLFKGGDSDEDIISFRNTYDAIVLYECVD